MQANWSLVLNILLLIGVITAIARMMKDRRKNKQAPIAQPSVGVSNKASFDDIIAVRKISIDESTAAPSLSQPVNQSPSRPILSKEPFAEELNPSLNKPALDGALPTKSLSDDGVDSSPIMILLMAKENRQLAGYELLQTLLASGLRLGEGHLFHRHQHANGQGPVLCSLAAATASGTFDLQNIGAFSVRGLCLFMHASGNPTIDAERFEIMLDTARQLCDGLDTYLLDDKRRTFSDESLKRYHRLLNLHDTSQFA